MLHPNTAEALLRIPDDDTRERLIRDMLNGVGSRPQGNTCISCGIEQGMRTLAGRRRGIDRMLLLSDEIYGGVQFDGRHRSAARYYRGGTIISDGLSKWAGAGGWRLGFFAFPKSLAWLRKAMAAAASETYTSVSAPIQHAAIAAFEGGPEMELYLQRSRAVLQALAEHVSRRLAAAGAAVPAPRRVARGRRSGVLGNEAATRHLLRFTGVRWCC